jgi:hypothetical protein
MVAGVQRGQRYGCRMRHAIYVPLFGALADTTPDKSGVRVLYSYRPDRVDGSLCRSPSCQLARSRRAVSSADPGSVV